MKEIQIEKITADDWQRLRAVRLRALADSPDAFGATHAQEEARPLGDWRTRLEVAENATFLAAAEDGSEVGLVVGTPWKWDADANAAGLFAMWVAPEVRGRGCGGALVDAVVGWARDGDYARIFLDVADGNAPAIALYRSKGFVRTGESGCLPAPREHISEHERVLVL